jgi:hypothetical protein
LALKNFTEDIVNVKILVIALVCFFSMPGRAFIPTQIGGCNTGICCEDQFDDAVVRCEVNYYAGIATCAGALAGCGCTVAINPLIIPCAVACFTLGATCAAQIPAAWLNYESCINTALRDLRNCRESVISGC